MTNISVKIKHQTLLARYKITQPLLSFQQWRDLQRIDNYISDHSQEILKEKAENLEQRLIKNLTNIKTPTDLNKHKLYWIMSTGRCGTRAIKKLLANDSNNFTVHRDLFSREEKLQGGVADKTNRTFVFNSLLNNTISDEDIITVTEAYLQQRLKTIERAGDKTFIFATHHDVAWLPIIIKLFPHSKFLHLLRAPDATINSFYTKEQYSASQILPYDTTKKILCFNSSFTMICWYWFYVNTYIKNSLDSLSDRERYLTIHSEELFSAGRDVHQKIEHFFDTHIPYDIFLNHFSTPINTKRNKNLSFIKHPSDWTLSMKKIYQVFNNNLSSGKN